MYFTPVNPIFWREHVFQVSDIDVSTAAAPWFTFTNINMSRSFIHYLVKFWEYSVYSRRWLNKNQENQFFERIDYCSVVIDLVPIQRKWSILSFKLNVFLYLDLLGPASQTSDILSGCPAGICNVDAIHSDRRNSNCCSFWKWSPCLHLKFLFLIENGIPTAVPYWKINVFSYPYVWDWLATCNVARYLFSEKAVKKFKALNRPSSSSGVGAK